MEIIINFKTYKQGKEVLNLVKKIERVAKKVNKKIIIGLQASDIYEVAKKTNLDVYAQHVDCIEKGRGTGFILPEAIKKDNAKGSFLNHSEHKLNFKILEKTINRCKKVGLKTAVFASSLKEAKKIERFKPDYLIFEPPELVSGTISVSRAKPELIKKIAKSLKMKFLVGAGIHSKKDVILAKKFGSNGIALSSAIMKAKNPEKILESLLEK